MSRTMFFLVTAFALGCGKETAPTTREASGPSPAQGAGTRATPRPPGRAEAAPPDATELDDERLVEFVEHPERFKGKTLRRTMAFLCPPGESLRESAGRDAFFSVSTVRGHASATVVVRMPSDLPHASRLDPVVVTFFCAEGSHERGNRGVAVTAAPKSPPPKGEPNDPPAGEKEDEPPGPLTDVTAADLAGAYVKNRGSADEKYTGRWLLVEGTVHDVGDQPEDARVVVVKLAGAHYPTGVHCFIRCELRPEASAAAWGLSRGQTVQIRGRCLGSLLGWVDLALCRVARKGPDPALAVTAAGLVADYRKDQFAADDKYRGKEVAVSGAYFVGVNASFATFSVSAKDKKVLLEVEFVPPQRKKVGALKPGQAVTFKAECVRLEDDFVRFEKAYLVP